jgi:hypothetical protein
MKVESYKAKLTKEFRMACEKRGIQLRGIGIRVALLLQRLTRGEIPLENVFDGRVRRQPPEGMGVLITGGKATFQPATKTYRLTDQGRALAAEMEGRGLFELAVKLDLKISKYAEEVAA